MYLLQIEDNRGDIMLVHQAVEAIDTHVELQVVEDGQAALDFLGQCGAGPPLRCPDVILLDLNLPRTQGENVLAELKQHPRLKGIPVVVFTGADDPHTVEHCYALGANAFLRKPMDIDEYFALIRTCVEFWHACQVPRLPPVP